MHSKNQNNPNPYALAEIGFKFLLAYCFTFLSRMNLGEKIFKRWFSLSSQCVLVNSSGL